jgi:uncharacterized membrane protein
MLKKKSKALQWGQFFALVASLLIAAQIGFIFYKGTSICLNEGCKVVEELTRVSPLVFNLVGLCFFQVIFWGLRVARNEPRRLPQWVKTLLLAGLAAEGVLISFQYLVAQTFCAYCLGILAFIVILNLLLGFRQIVPGLLLFIVVSLAFASLKISPPQSSQQAFTAGIFASRTGAEKQPENFLFFSSTCAHCEKVIAALQTNNRATVHFNPIDQVKDLDLAGISRNGTYSPTVNKALLSALGIEEIPVLMTKTPEGLSIRRGETAILAYLGKTTLPDTARQSGTSPAPVPQSSIPGLDTRDSCSVATDCADDPNGASPQSGR